MIVLNDTCHTKAVIYESCAYVQEPVNVTEPNIAFIPCAPTHHRRYRHQLPPSLQKKTLQECETALTSQYGTLVLVSWSIGIFVFLSYCLCVFLSFCLFSLILIFSYFCLFVLILERKTIWTKFWRRRKRLCSFFKISKVSVIHWPRVGVEVPGQLKMTKYRNWASFEPTYCNSWNVKVQMLDQSLILNLISITLEHSVPVWSCQPSAIVPGSRI